MQFDYKPFLKSLNALPGVYQMYDADEQILYVGKAKNLKSRISSYFRSRSQTAKTQALVQRIASVEVTITATEAEALILEQNLIKQQRPPYNVLLRDDKSYPYILVSDQEWPRLAFHRGTKRKKGQYFGPFPNAQVTRKTLSMLQKVFRVRQCEDSFFNNRSRPCLQYQIARCSAPCVGLVDKDDYRQDLQHSIDLLKGDDTTLGRKLIAKMNAASETLDFESAARLRDQVNMIRTIQADQVIEKGAGNMDVVSATRAGNEGSGEEGCVHMLFVRQGRIVGSRSFFPRSRLEESAAELLETFLSQHYLTGPTGRVPGEILVSAEVKGRATLEQALRQQVGRKVGVRKPKRGRGLEWLQIAGKAAEQNLLGRNASRKNHARRLLHLAGALQLDADLQRLECYDISHTQGNQTVGACVVFDQEGPSRKDYRRFNISGVPAGDDYAAMEQVLRRRFIRLQKGEGIMPDLLVIDGGKGQLGKAREVMADLGVQGVAMLGVAKGTTRKSGWERLFLGDDSLEIVLDPSSPGFHLLQHIRDEAHRFAITGHKARRGKKFVESPLQEIPGIGDKRRKNLVDHFGGYKGVEAASVADLARVEGISRDLAQNIYDYFHSS